MSKNHAMWFSPDSIKLAYVRFNDTNVNEVKLPYYEPYKPLEHYTQYSSLRYPKAGTPNPTTDLMVVHLQGDQNSFILRPPTIIRQK